MSEIVKIIYCPICGKPFQVDEKDPQPTCGDPNCYREARSRGLTAAAVAKPPTKELPLVREKGKTPFKKKKAS